MDSRIIKERQEVEAFLKQFFPKMSIWGILFLDRAKNRQALAALGIIPAAREEIIKSIKSVDYVETIVDMISFGEMWVFGKDFDDTELYIKIAMGEPGSKTICISLHTAERAIKYAFKHNSHD